jgi:hypothetical protein
MLMKQQGVDDRQKDAARQVSYKFGMIFIFMVIIKQFIVHPNKSD